MYLLPATFLYLCCWAGFSWKWSWLSLLVFFDFLTYLFLTKEFKCKLSKSLTNSDFTLHFWTSRTFEWGWCHMLFIPFLPHVQMHPYFNKPYLFVYLCLTADRCSFPVDHSHHPLLSFICSRSWILFFSKCWRLQQWVLLAFLFGMSSRFQFTH